MAEAEDYLVTKTAMRFLKHHFSEAEKLRLADEMSEGVNELQRLQDQKKAVTSQFSSKINEVSARVYKGAEMLRSGFEMRDREVEIRYNYATKEVTVWDPEVQELIEERTMTADELQMVMDFEEEEGEEQKAAPETPEVGLEGEGSAPEEQTEAEVEESDEEADS